MSDFWRAIWNGPFYIGQLTRPVSVGDAIMKVLETAWRALVIVFALVLACLALIFFTAWRDQAKSEKIRADVNAATSVSAAANFEACGPAFPIQVRITNAGDRELDYVTFRIKVIDPQDDRDITPSHFINMSTERAIGPRKTLLKCVSPYADQYGSRSSLQRLEPRYLVSAELIWAQPAY